MQLTLKEWGVMLHFPSVECLHKPFEILQLGIFVYFP